MSSVQRAMEIDPQSLPAQRAAVVMALRLDQPAQALAVARTVQA